MMTGATIETPNGICIGASASPISSSKICRWIADQPVPPNFFGQAGPPQPRLWSVACQPSKSCLVYLRPVAAFWRNSRDSSASRNVFTSARKDCSSGV